MAEWLVNRLWQAMQVPVSVLASSATRCKAQSRSVPIYEKGTLLNIYNTFLKAEYAK